MTNRPRQGPAALAFLAALFTWGLVAPAAGPVAATLAALAAAGLTTAFA